MLFELEIHALCKWRTWVRNGAWFHATHPLRVSGPVQMDDETPGGRGGREGCMSRA